MQIVQLFNYTKAINTIEEYQNFIKKHENTDTKYIDSCYIYMSILYEQKLNQCYNIKDYESFINKYDERFPSISCSKFIKLAKDKVDSIRYEYLQVQLKDKSEESILSLQEFIEKYPYSKYLNNCKEDIKKIYQKELDKSLHNINQLRSYVEKYNSSIFDQKYKVEYINIACKNIKLLEWSTDEDAWNTTITNGDLFSYRKYSQLYPYGKYINKANKRIIDLEVDKIFGSSYGELPKMNKEYSNQNKSCSTITVENSTSYTLTLLYSGIESKRLIIKPLSTQSITLPNGYYRIAASVNSSNIRAFAGNENLVGGNYSTSYYIEASYTNNRHYHF